MTRHARLRRQCSRLRSDRKLRLYRLRTRKWIWRRRAEEVIAYPDRSRGGRRVCRIRAVLMTRRDHVDAALTKQSHALGRGERYTTEVRARNTGNPVMLCQLFIQKCVIRTP